MRRSIFERRHFSAEELGRWGMRWENATDRRLIDGKPAEEVRYAADPVATTLEVVADRDTISPQAKDCVRVMVRALDQAGPQAAVPVRAGRRSRLPAPAGCIGPGLVPLRGGSTGFWIESTGAAGDDRRCRVEPALRHHHHQRFAPNEEAGDERAEAARRTQVLRRRRGDQGRRSRHREPRVRRLRRSLGLRQVDPAAHDRGPRIDHCGRTRHRRQAR